MAASHSGVPTNSGLQDTSSDTNDEEKGELCPGFKDVDAFVKVSELTQADVGLLSQVGNVELQSHYKHTQLCVHM